MAAGDVFDTTLADSPPTTYSDPVYGTPDFARFIPTDTLDQIQRDQEANAWATDQRGRIADLWGQYTQDQVNQMVQKYTAVTPQTPDMQAGTPIDGIPTPTGTASAGTDLSAPYSGQQMDAGTQDQQAVPTGPVLGPPQPTMQEHGQNFVQGMLQALQQAQGQPAAPIPENRAGLPGENPLQKLQAGFQNTGAALGDLVNPQPGIGETLSEAIPGLGVGKLINVGSSIAKDALDAKSRELSGQNYEPATKDWVPGTAGAVALGMDPTTFLGPGGAEKAGAEAAAGAAEKLAPDAAKAVEGAAPDLIQNIVKNLGLDLAKPADAARLQAAQDLLSNEKLTANMQKAVDKNLANAKPADNALSTRMSDAYALQQEIEKARAAAPEPPVPPEVTPPATGAPPPPPPPAETPPTSPSAEITPARRQAAIQALLGTKEFSDPTLAGQLVDKLPPDEIDRLAGSSATVTGAPGGPGKPPTPPGPPVLGPEGLPPEGPEGWFPKQQALTDALPGTAERRPMPESPPIDIGTPHPGDPNFEPAGVKPPVEKPPIPEPTGTAPPTSMGGPLSFAARLQEHGIPYEVGQYIANSVPNVVGGAASGAAAYKATEGQDEKVRIAAALAAASGGLKATHVLFGGPATKSAMAARLGQGFIGSLISPSTVVKKLLYDVPTTALAPISRGLAATSNGRLGTAAPEAIAAAGAMWDALPQAMAKAAKAFDPGQAAHIMGEQVTKDGKPFLFEHPSLGQTASTATLRGIDAATQFTQHMLKASTDAANKVAMDAGAAKAGLPDPAKFAKEMTFLGEPRTLAGEGLQKMFDAVARLPGIGPVLQPMKKVPVGVFEQKMDFLPGLGTLTNAFPSSAVRAAGTEAVKQRTAQFATRQVLAGGTIALLAGIFGDQVHGPGPDPNNKEQTAAFRAEGSRQFSFRFPGTSTWLDMHSLPPGLSSPLQAYGVWQDAKKYGSADDQQQAFNRLAAASLATIDNNHALPNVLALYQAVTTGDQAGVNRWLLNEGSMPLWESRIAAGVGRDYQPDRTTSKLSAPESLAKGFQNSIPGPRPPAQDALGRPIPNFNQGAGSVFNPLHPSQQMPSPVIDYFSKSNVEIPPMPTTITTDNGKVQLEPDERLAFQRARGQYLMTYFDKHPNLPSTVDKKSVDQRASDAHDLMQQANDYATKQIVSTLGKDVVKQRETASATETAKQAVQNIGVAGGQVPAKKTPSPTTGGATKINMTGFGSTPGASAPPKGAVNMAGFGS